MPFDAATPFATAFDAAAVSPAALAAAKLTGAALTGALAAHCARALFRRTRVAGQSTAPVEQPARSLDDTIRALTATTQGPLDVIALSRLNPQLMLPTAESIALSRKYQRIERRLRARRALLRRLRATLGAPLAAYRAARLRARYAPTQPSTPAATDA